MAGNKTMNALIANSARRGERQLGVIDKLRGVAPLEAGPQGDLNAAMASYEHACRHGDEAAKQTADAEIERLLNQARAARQPASPSFDGGVRRPVRRPETNMNTLIARAAGLR
jgi:hypothetical protein